MKEEQEITEIFDEMSKAMEQGEIEKLASFYSEKKNYLHLGTAKNENYYGREGMKEAAKLTGKTRVILLVPPQIYFSGNFAWVIRKGVITSEGDDLDNEYRVRATYILEREEDGWKIVHLHISTPDHGIEEGQIFATISGIETQIAKWINTFDLDPQLSSKIDAKKFKSYLLQAQKILSDLEDA